MTVIVWRDGVLAADSRMTAGDLVGSDNMSKLYKVSNAPYLGDTLLYMGLGGQVSDIDKYRVLLNMPEWYMTTETTEVCGIMVGKKFVYYIEPKSNFLIRCSKKSYLAIGSGDIAAFTALDSGASAVEAVRSACKRVITCGGRVRSVRV